MDVLDVPDQRNLYIVCDVSGGEWLEPVADAALAWHRWKRCALCCGQLLGGLLPSPSQHHPPGHKTSNILLDAETGG